MNIGPFTLNVDWEQLRPKRPDPDEAAIAFLRDHPAGRQLVARMARSEVKNYLAELAEQAEVPFDDPVSCLRNVWNLYQYGKSPYAQALDRKMYGEMFSPADPDAVPAESSPARDETFVPRLDLHNGEALPGQKRSVPYTGPAPEPHHEGATA